MTLLILLAEDDPGIRLAVKDYLELSGYSTIVAGDGEAALSLLETYHPHLLVSDIKMPKKDGYQLIKEIRQRPEFRLLPVIFLTERGTTEERIHGYQAGCDAYLPKPFELEELGAVIRNLLDRSQAIAAEMRFAERKTYESIQGEIPIVSLTQREKQVLELLAGGLANAEIGNQLHLSSRTVEKYVSSLLRKTEKSNRSELVRFALEHHLTDAKVKEHGG